MQVRTHAQKYFQKLSTMVVSRRRNHAQNSRSSQAFSKRRVREPVAHVKYEESEKTETSESSTTISTKSDTTITVEIEKRQKKETKPPSAHEPSTESRSVAPTPHSPVPELNLTEVDLMYSGYSQCVLFEVIMRSRCPYQSLSPFEQEVRAVVLGHD